jgi:hypothetical protein
VTAPVLWVTAADSFVFKQLFAVDSADYRKRVACFNDVREVMLEDCGHNLHHDQPQQVAAPDRGVFCHMKPLNADLHCHSTVSDGLLAPSDLVRRARRKMVSNCWR